MGAVIITLGFFGVVCFMVVMMYKTYKLKKDHELLRKEIADKEKQNDTSVGPVRTDV